MKKEMNIEAYLWAVRRRLNLPRDVKKRVMEDLRSSIDSRREAGQTDEQIMSELGTPQKAAEELNQQMKEFRYHKSPWRWGCLALAVGSLISLLFNGFTGLISHLLNNAVDQSVGIIGGADGPTAVFVTISPDALQNNIIIGIVLLAMGIVGFYYLGHMRSK